MSETDISGDETVIDPSIVPDEPEDGWIENAVEDVPPTPPTLILVSDDPEPAQDGQED